MNKYVEVIKDEIEQFQNQFGLIHEQKKVVRKKGKKSKKRR